MVVDDDHANATVETHHDDTPSTRP